jgi:hypothetical protein
VYGGGGYRPKPQRRCWCGSGKKEKNCHGKREAANSVPAAAGAPSLRAVTPQAQVELSPWVCQAKNINSGYSPS